MGASRHLACLSVAASVLWLALVAAAADENLWKLVILGVTAALAMIVGAALAHDRPAIRFQTAIDALAGGAMLTSACIYLIPTAIKGHPGTGVIGIAAGLFAARALQHRHAAQAYDPILSALCLHALSAGAVIGMIYTRMPGLGLSAGLAIVSHKLPAGYVVGRSLRISHRPRYPVLLPATAIGLTSLPIALWQPHIALPQGLLFGFASGLFAMVAMTYLANTRSRGLAQPSAMVAALLSGVLVVSLAYIVLVLV